MNEAETRAQLNLNKLFQLIEIKYCTIYDAIAQLGPAFLIRQMFIGFPRYLSNDINTG
ncbi:MAG: hypothetical protein ACRC8Y_12480 [Chroococcales cyanobacterium]